MDIQLKRDGWYKDFRVDGMGLKSNREARGIRWNVCQLGEGKRLLSQVESPKVFAVSLSSVNVDGIEERVETDACGFYPFPRSRALTLFSEGGLFSMTADFNWYCEHLCG